MCDFISVWARVPSSWAPTTCCCKEWLRSFIPPTFPSEVERGLQTVARETSAWKRLQLLGPTLYFSQSCVGLRQTMAKTLSDHWPKSSAGSSDWNKYIKDLRYHIQNRHIPRKVVCSLQRGNMLVSVSKDKGTAALAVTFDSRAPRTWVNSTWIVRVFLMYYSFYSPSNQRCESQHVCSCQKNIQKTPS